MLMCQHKKQHMHRFPMSGEDLHKLRRGNKGTMVRDSWAILVSRWVILSSKTLSMERAEAMSWMLMRSMTMMARWPCTSPAPRRATKSSK